MVNIHILTIEQEIEFLQIAFSLEKMGKQTHDEVYW